MTIHISKDRCEQLAQLEGDSTVGAGVPERMKSSMRRRTSKCEECPYKDAKPSQRSRDELAYARCTPPELFECHMEGGGGHGDGETMCRGHWEVYQAAVKREIEADESAGDRVFGDLVTEDEGSCPPVCTWCETPMSPALDSVGNTYYFCRTSSMHGASIDGVPIQPQHPNSETEARHG